MNTNSFTCFLAHQVNIYALGLVLITVTIGNQTQAQTASLRTAVLTDDYVLERGDNEFGVWGGGSFDSPTVIGTSEDRKFGILGVRYGRVLAANEKLAFQYTVDAIPLAVLSQPTFNVIQSPTDPNASTVERRRQTTYGAGLSPIGFKLNFRNSKRVQPFADTSGGFIYFTEQVPVVGASQFNFAFDFGGGVRIFTKAKRAVTVGYKFHHLSSGGTSNINPGIDANIFYAGFSVFK